MADLTRHLSPPDGPALLYFADPMCSWCWGFAPTALALADSYAASAPLRLVLGGLRPGNETPMAEHHKVEIRHHWEHVHEASGQPFDFAFFERDGFVYDTEPACRAVAAARWLDAAQTLPFLDRVHRAFYAANRDVTDAEVLVALGAEAGFDADAFAEAFESAAVKARLQEDFALSRSTGVRGFPTLLGWDGAKMTVLTMGFRPPESMREVIERWSSQV